MNEALERNRQNAIAFYDLMFNQCRPAETIEHFERINKEHPGKRVLPLPRGTLQG
jgi:hypothetical protein